MTDARPFLALHGVSKRFGGTIALDRIDWDVTRGEVHCLVGENGSGKSTLIKIVAGVHRPELGGRIAVDGSAFDALTPHRAHALGIHVIYQDLSLFPNLSVLENIGIEHSLGSLARTVDRRAMRASAEDAIARLAARLPLDARVEALPIAERQLVAICRGIAADARLLIMDEPTASLSRREVASLLDVVGRLKAIGVAVVFVSHRLEEVVAIAERVTVLRDGAKVGTWPAPSIDHQRLAELMTGNRIEYRIVARTMHDRPIALEARRATRPGAFDDVSFKLHRGEVLGLIGLLGAGRTELALALFGMEPIEAGEILVDGVQARLGANRDALASGIAYVSEDRLALGVNLRQSISDNIAVTVLDELRDRCGLVTQRRRAALAREWIARLAMRAPDPAAPVQTLSGGNQQRVVLAKWLAKRPKVLILDSPTAGVDIRNKQGIYDVIHALAADGISIILISDEVPEVYFNCDRILHMRERRIVGEFVPGTATEADLTAAVYA